MRQPKYQIDVALDKMINKYFVLSLFLSSLYYLVAYNFFVGLIFLIIRQLRYTLGFGALGFYIFGFLMVVFVAVINSHKTKLNKESCLAILDEHNEMGGLLVSFSEVSNGQWLRLEKRSYKIPNFNVNFDKSLIYLSISFIFLILGIMAPVKDVFQGVSRLELTEIESLIEAQVKGLEKGGFITEREREDYFLALEELLNEADGRDPSKSFEALDHLQFKLNQASKEAAMQLVSELGELEKMRESVDGSSEELFNEMSRHLSGQDESNFPADGDLQQAKEELKSLIDQRIASKRNAMSQMSDAGLLSHNMMTQLLPEDTTKVMQETVQDVKMGSEAGEESGGAENMGYEEITSRVNPKDATEEYGANDQPAGGAGEQGEQKTVSGDFPQKRKEKGEGGGGQGMEAPSEMASEGAAGGMEGGGDVESGEMLISSEGGIGGRDGGGHSPLNYSRTTSDHGVSYGDERIENLWGADYSSSVYMGMAVSAPQRVKARGGVGDEPGEVGEVLKTHKERETVMPQHKRAVTNYFTGHGESNE